MGGISLTASMRSNLLSLQNISGQVDLTQNKLSTGKKVNSAIDNPSSYYTALSLNNRADDLNALLDSMGQAVSTIKAATTALESAADFLEQASAVATQTLDELKNQESSIIAQVSTEEELLAAINSGQEGVIVLKQDITMSTNQNIVLKDGQSLAGIRYLDSSKQQTKLNFNFDGVFKEAITLGNNTTLSDLEINVTGNVTGAWGKAIIMGTSKRYLTYRNLDINMNFDTAAVKNFVVAIYGGTATLEGNNNIVYSGQQGSVLDTRAIMNANLTFNDAILNVSNCQYGIGNGAEKITLNGNSQYNCDGRWGLLYSNLYLNDNSNLNMGSSYGLTGTVLYIQSKDVKVNLNSKIPLWEGNEYKMEINAVSGATIKMPSGSYTATADISGLIITGTSKELPASEFTKDDTATAEEDETYKSIMDDFEAYIEKCKNNRLQEPSLGSEYSEIISQYDALIKDASYKGINLLQTDKLNVKFNEDNTANLNIQGKDMSSEGLGLKTLKWTNADSIAQSLSEIASALKSIRNYSAELGNNYSIITTRQDFTESLINVLTEGADKLTLADMNEESANMLALQTRQQLAINSLSLASQASQSILKLF